VQIGEGTRIWHWVKIGLDRPAGVDVVIGKNCVIGCRVEIGPGVVIGDDTHIGAASQIHHPAKIGQHVFIAPMVFLSNDKYPSLEVEFVPQGVVIEDHAIIGAGAQIMGGVTIGEGAFVGMGSLVMHDVAPGSMVRGRPARPYGTRGKHWPGTALEHWGPLCDEQACKMCKASGLEQYAEWMNKRVLEHGGQDG